jgi:type VI protein secretion system component VasF
MSHARRSHQRSTAAVVLTRSDLSLNDPAPRPPAPPSARSRLWATVFVWVVLGGVIAALWASLLFGDASPLNG